VPEELIHRREAAQRELDAADQAIRDHIEGNEVPEIDLSELDEDAAAADGS
jgi:hypothetical protein